MSGDYSEFSTGAADEDDVGWLLLVGAPDLYHCDVLDGYAEGSGQEVSIGSTEN